MAVNTTLLGTVYDTLNARAEETLDKQWNDRRLKGEDYASLVGQTILSLIQTSASLIENDLNRVEQARQFDANKTSQETLEANNLAEKKREFDASKTSQETLEANNLAEKKREFDAELASNAPIKTAQKNLIDKQIDTEVASKLLKERQKTAYDDNLRIEEGKMLTQVVGMHGAGGTALPTGLETTMINAVNAVTP